MLIKDAKLIPDWLKEHLKEDCPYCGEPYHVGYSPNGTRVTKHYCANRQCPGTLAMKMVFVWTVLKVDGIKEGKSKDLIKRYSIKKHLDAIPYVFDEKPKIYLDTFMRLNCIQDIDDAWSDVCAGKNSLEEVLSSSTAQRYMSPEDMEDAREALEYFDIQYEEKQQFEPVVRMTIMMTGDVMELKNRELLIVALNQRYKGLLDLRYSKSKRKTGISVLIKEEHSTITGKVDIAEEAGVPIMTSTEFILYVDKLIREKAGDKYNEL